MGATSPTPDDERWSANGTGSGVRRAPLDRLVVLGYITAVSMPLIGFIIAAVVARRFAGQPTARHAAWIVAIGIVASVLWILVLSSGVLSSASTDY